MKHKCENSDWKVDYQGVLRCVCGESKAQNPAALTDNFPGGKADTSREAFRSHKRSETLEKVIGYLRRAGRKGMTADQMAVYLGVEQATTSARFNDLKRAGLVEKAERRATRSGRSAWAWRIK